MKTKDRNGELWYLPPLSMGSIKGELRARRCEPVEREKTWHSFGGTKLVARRESYFSYEVSDSLLCVRKHPREKGCSGGGVCVYVNMSTRSHRYVPTRGKPTFARNL